MAIWPSNYDIDCLKWIAMALSNSKLNLEHLGCVPIQYFWSMPHNKNVQKFYTCWNSRNGLQLKVDPTNGEV